MTNPDIRLALMCGIDIPVPQCQIVVSQPRIKDIAFIGETAFFTGAQCLCINKNMIQSEDKTLLSDTSNFQIFMTIMANKETLDKKQATLQVLKLLFPTYNIIVTPRSMMLTTENSSPITIDNNNFEHLQESLKQILCVGNSTSQEQGFNPADDPRAQEIARKLMRGRERVAAQKGQGAHSNDSILGRYCSILATGLHKTLEEMENMTLYQLYDQVERYQLYQAWDMDARIRLAGGKPDDQPENWEKNIH